MGGGVVEKKREEGVVLCEGTMASTEGIIPRRTGEVRVKSGRRECLGDEGTHPCRSEGEGSSSHRPSWWVLSWEVNIGRREWPVPH